MVFQPNNQHELQDRDERLFALLSQASHEQDPRGRDWIAIVLWALVLLTLIAGAALLWVLY